MDRAYLQNLYEAHVKCPDCPPPAVVAAFFDELLGTMFPDFSKKYFASVDELDLHINKLKLQLSHILFKNPSREQVDWEGQVEVFFEALPGIQAKLDGDVEAMYQGDPAAKSPNEVRRTYPGFYAIAAYRIAHQLHIMSVQVIPRIITEHAHSKTGIDIHPGAQIGESFCIDHGTGIVIGETAIIGNHVKIYQGVTLGALSVNKEDAAKKRHPTIEDHVTIYAGATILGGNTVIGHDSIIGGNVWITRSIPPSTKVYYKAKMHNEETGDTDLIVFKTSI
ncbi:serine acetyltransferase [Rhodocytophaga aerolata]|uniref:Serine acetyltransferase n=1 Tax=Rhodocytophaga aerolata TaxID=455078 RepID=A0ABT8RAY5_9BACT|nr:serine acetyltransferase [Rhodocytophaga aerolata]MDO1449268.1 serine acetyltransferase [Rhodocytophaga aerolata]